MQRSFSIPNVSIALYLPLCRISTYTPHSNTPMYAICVRHCAVCARYGVYIRPIAFGVSFFRSQISIEDLGLQVSFTTFR